MKRYILVVLMALLAVPMAWAGSSDPDPDAWTPSESYAGWIHEFNIDKVFAFTNEGGVFDDNRPNDGVYTEDAPGMLSFSIMTWHNRASCEDDHCMDWARIYLHNGATTEDFLIADIDFDGGESGQQNAQEEWKKEGSYLSHTNGQGCTTWFVQKRMHTQWSNGRSGSGAQWCYFVTEYGDDLKNFATRAGNRLQLRVVCRWDDVHWNNYDKTTNFAFSQTSTLVAPVLGTVAWEKDGDKLVLNTSVQNTDDKAQTRLTLKLSSGEMLLYDWGSVSGGNVKTTIPATSINRTLLEGNYNIEAQSRKVYNISRTNWRSGHGCSISSKVDYSSKKQKQMPCIMQAYDLQGSSINGVNKISWKVNPGDDSDEKCDFIVDRSLYSDFSRIDKTEHVSYSASATEYSLTDVFDERNRGDLDFYYRVRRDKISPQSTVNSVLKVTAETNYPKIQNLNVENRNGQSIVVWTLTNNGIRTEDMDLLLTWAGNTNVLHIDTTSFVMTGLTACQPFDIRLELRERQMVATAANTSYMLPSSRKGRLVAMELSKGFYTDHVDMTWRVSADSSNFAYYSVERKNMKDDPMDETWVQLGTVNHVQGILNYSYSDNTCVPGEYYNYRVTGYSECSTMTSVQHMVHAVGFSQPFGVVSGQITYQNDEAVSNVKVSAIGAENNNRALVFSKPDTIPVMQNVYTGQTVYPYEIDNPFYNKVGGTLEFLVENDVIYAANQYLFYGYKTFATYIKVSNGKLTLQVASGVANYDLLQSGSLWKSGETNLISVVFNSNNLTSVYINGQKAMELSASGNWKITPTFLIGMYDRSKHYPWQGDILEIRGWSVVRTQAEIQANMNTAFTGSESNLAYLYQQKPVYKTIAAAQVKYDYASLKYEHANMLLGTDAGTVEFWLRPEAITGGEQTILYRDKSFNYTINAQGMLTFSVYSENGDTNSVSANLRAETTGFEPRAYNHVAVTYGEDATGVWSMCMWINGKLVSRNTQRNGSVSICHNQPTTELLVGTDHSHYFQGYMDELRFWDIYRDSLSIVSQMNGYLSGNEYGLTGYYRFDNENTGELYDISRTNNAYNQRHMRTNGRLTIERNVIPDEEQLSLCTRTDKDGNYVLNAIPYAETGSTFSIVPTLGVHSFTPAQRPLYFNRESSTHNSINFTDNSSFLVSGYVLYENTDYPVAGCTFTVDGMGCAKDNKLVETDENGYYEISVPVGSHYIEIRKPGHTFVGDGRYPTANPNFVTTVDFQGDVTGLNWTDNTKVVLTGRVAGGNIEGSKPHGMQQGKNNIGTARISLSPVAKDKYDLNLQDSIVTLPAPEDCAVNSRTTVAAKGGMAARRITIVTDSVTGEFSALVPPIDLTVDSLTVPSNDEVFFNVASFGTLELSKCDTMYNSTDTVLYRDGTTRMFNYLAALDAIYLRRPILTIQQTDREDEFFGVDIVVVDDPLDVRKKDTVQIINRTGENRGYVYGVPFFMQDITYEMNLLCSEQYTNYDYATPRIDTVPVVGSKVAISNGLGKPAENYSNSMTMDEYGRGTYRFVGGEPNITTPLAGQAPYRCHLSATYTNANGDVYYDWDGNKSGEAVVLGSVSVEGTNFITEGPAELLYILRDPPGAKSTATWKSGTTFKSNTTETRYTYGGEKTKFVFHTGLTVESGAGSPAFVVIGSLDNTDDVTVGGMLAGGDTKDTHTTTSYTISESISTESDDCHVGASGDVYVGISTNWNFSSAKNLHFARNAESGEFELVVDDATSVGRSYGTDFAYSQFALETIQLPLMVKQRNALLQTVPQDIYDLSDTALISRFATEKEYRYITALTEDSAKFGEAGTYKAIAPTAASGQEMVNFYNEAMRRWKSYFAYNDSVKLVAINAALKPGSNSNITSTNYSIDGGANRSFSSSNNEVQYSSSHASYYYGEFSLQEQFSRKLNGFGLTFTETMIVNFQNTDKTGTDTTSVVTNSYNFNLNAKEQLSVDAIEGTDAYSPIFYTRGGQTYCPYEPVVYTKYYQPDSNRVLAVATQQIENPVLRVNQTEVSGIPAGGHALYELHLGSEVATTLPSDYQLMINNTTNPNGAQLFVAGAALSSHPMTLRLKPGEETTVLLELRQTDLERLDYDDIEIRFASQCSPNVTYSAVKISAHFVASCPEVKMSVNKLIANREDPTILFRLTDYDCSVKTFEKLRLEYKKTTDADFTQQIATFDRDTLEKSSVFTYRWNTSDLVDGAYEVRVVGVCRLGNEEILYEGAPVTIIKDTAIPQALGLPSPINGIYTNDNEVYVTFNEPINTALIKETDVEVMGAMNGGDVCTDIALAAHTNGRMAETEAGFVLENTGFSLEAWVRIDSLTAGSLIGIGDKYRVNVTTQGKLSVYYWIDNTRYTATSTETLPLNKWFYLCVQQELLSDGSAIVHAHCAYDSYSLTLLNEAMPAYSVTAPVQVLSNFQGAVSMCELQLWREYREWATVQSSIYQTKELSRTGLYGYWPMHDGRGTVAKEMMRGRNLVLPSENWRYKDTNRALHISEQTMAVLDFSDKSIMGEDHALEFWFRRTEPGALYANISGVDTTYMILTNSAIECHWGDAQIRQPLYTNFCDGAWHHLAFILRHQSESEVLIDGKPYLTSSITFDTDLDGIFIFSPDSTAMDMDELRIWKATITPDWIKDNMRNRVRPDATGLLVNFPMEDALLADVAADALYQHPSLTSRYDSIPLTYAADAPAMVTVKNEQVVPHTYTASDTKLVINITAKPSQIEGQTLNFLVKSLPDTHNNLSKDVRWSAYVHRNLLEWDDQERTITKEVLNREQIALTFTNRSGNIESWTISGLPDWMSVSESTGSLAQLTTKTVILTIDESLAIGHYEPVIYLSGNQGIYDPLPLHIQVTGDRPNWSINPADFTYSMNIIGRMATSEGFVVDTADMIAAKVKGKLVGVTHPQVISKGGSILVMMDVYADIADSIATGNNGPVVDFEYWDASTGLVYTGVQTSIRQNGVYVPLTIRFKDGAILGTLMDPVRFTLGNTIRQEVDIHVGWNWCSFNVLPLDKAASEFLQPLLPYTDMVKTQDSYAEMDSIRQLLVGSLDSIDVGKGYRIRSLAETTKTLTGLYVNPIAIPIPLRRGWSWIGYVPNMTLSVGAAMVNHHAENGDIVKGQQGFSIFADGQWVGSLRAMTPGASYMYYSNSLWPTSFYYPSPAAVALAPMRVAAEEDNLHYNPISRSEFSSNMTVTAIVMDGEVELAASTLEVAVFAGNQCRTAMRGTDDRFFLTIPGDDAAELQFRVWDGVSERVAKQTISFESDAQYGTYRQPYIIQLGEMSEGLDAVDDQDNATKVIVNDVVYVVRGGKWHDVLGRPVEKPIK